MLLQVKQWDLSWEENNPLGKTLRHFLGKIRPLPEHYGQVQHRGLQRAREQHQHVEQPAGSALIPKVETGENLREGTKAFEF